MADDPTPLELVEFAVDAAWIAGRITLEYFQTPVAHEAKADASPVTIADRRAETALREMIAARYPSHAVLGEEFGRSGPDDARYRWILDPIDGTLSFITIDPTLAGFEFVVADKDGRQRLVTRDGQHEYVFTTP